MLFDNLLLDTTYQGYIAGTGDGIVTVAGLPAQRDVVVLNVNDLSVVARNVSLKNGRYLITNLDPSKKYLIMARDYNKEYQPAVWDYVTPATDLTIAEQQALWENWQTI